ncbi:peptidase inhibitor family I36 protein [Jatrophihabitans endophyticus]|uniref:peptidase inhibitor family I36 protein n=1 Tax=Jatrophihabitans endophyticus TaxID=1206085 RepID=UPI000932A88D|nr:peptidase inhibitor family I36 protein [Jatrophihabitans endophyticus]
MSTVAFAFIIGLPTATAVAAPPGMPTYLTGRSQAARAVGCDLIFDDTQLCVTSSANFTSCVFGWYAPDSNFANNYYRTQSQDGAGCGDPNHTVDNTIDSAFNSSDSAICLYTNANYGGSVQKLAAHASVQKVKYHNAFSSWKHC